MPALVPTLRSLLDSFAVRVATEIKLLAYLAKANTLTADQTFSTGRLNLTGPTTNVVEFDPAGLGTPTLGAAPTAGQKVTLYRTRSANDSDYAIGVASNELWFSVGSASNSRAFGWYWGTNRRMRLDSAGSLSVIGTATAASFQNSSATRTSATAIDSGKAATNLCDAGAGAFALTLYSASTTPGQRFTFVKTDASANAVTVVVAGGGTINGRASVALASRYDWVEVESTATAGVWLIVGRSPAVVTDAIPPAVTGQIAVSTYIYSTAAVAPTSGKIVCHRIERPATWSMSGFRFAVSGAITAGTGTCTEYIGLYPDDGTGSKPDMSAGPIASASITETGLGSGTKTLAAALANQPPGVYWTVALYVVGATAPTAAPTLTGAATVIQAFPQTTFNVASKYLTHSATFTALPTTQPSASGWSYGVDNAGVVVGLALT